MDDLEANLRKLPLRVPSPMLDLRVAAQMPQRPTEQPAPRWRVPLWSAAAASIAMAIVGFGAGVAWRGEKPAVGVPIAPPVTVQVIYNAPASGNPFDFTHASEFLPAGEMEAKIQTGRGV